MNIRRCGACAVCVVLLLLCVLPGAAASDGRGSLTVVSRFDGIAFTGRTFSLYAVAQPAAEGGYTPAPAFADCGVAFPVSGNAADWSRCASALWQFAQLRALPPDAQMQSDADGRCTFSELPAGLYLVVGADVVRPEGSYTCTPFLVCLPGVDAAGNGREWDVTAMTKDEFHPAEPDSPKPAEPVPADPAEPDVPGPADTPQPDGNRLPQTGQLNWPVPVLAGTGLALFLAGLLLLRRRHA